MGVDLALLPFEANYNSSFNVLWLERNYDVWKRIEKLETHPVQEGFRSHCGHSEKGDYCYGETKEDRYGSEIRWVYARDIAPLLEGPEGAYVKALPGDYRIALFWH